ncbi:MAG: S8 family serine peptidase [Euryarchaeota archaeon]|nr:S8 family serine peptidase [Euryarchaeota archaeon]MBT7987412.1 S8 family serine peptidase [Euryarchaeota archaeon]
MKQFLAVLLCVIFFLPLTGSIYDQPVYDRADWTIADDYGIIWHHVDSTDSIPIQQEPQWAGTETAWWDISSYDINRNGIHDSIESATGMVGMGISYDVEVTEVQLQELANLGIVVVDTLESINSVLIGLQEVNLADSITNLSNVVMVHQYGAVKFYGDIQTPNVKARNSSIYPDAAWNFGVTGKGVNIAMVDTGVDNEHPGLVGKFVAGYDAVCYLHTDPTCVAAGLGARETDGSFDPDDGNQHGTACIGMSSATGIEADGSQGEFYGSAPGSTLVDVRIGTDAGAGPFENYVLEQEFYESAMNGIQWIIDNKDTAWAGVDESLHGIDIISLSWGITSHEGGGSDGSDMHSMILDVAMEEGIVVSVAAGNDGPNNDGLSGMGSSDLSITVGATDDGNTIIRDDDTIASYSSRGPRRDNGDGNPLNELKPEVSAPGTNIIQAEGCVTSGGCNNLLGGDASSNTYTSRGSGTSYAAPAVSGILALMIEANPNLTAFEMKEILKFTAERKGEPTQPDVDPFWNRDFGWGLVDAYEAVKLSIKLRDQGLNGLIDVNTQVHVESSSIDNQSGLYVIQGIAWGQMGSVNAIEYRINDGEWMSVAFEQTNSSLSALERFSWSLALDLDKISKGNNSLEIRGLSDDGQSLPITIIVQGNGNLADSSESFIWDLLPNTIFFALFIILGLLLWNSRTENPEALFLDSNDSIAKVLKEDKDLASVVDAELLEG